jgi:hypothetical protein
MRKFDLNIDTILEHWTVADAVREIIANAIDEETLTGTSPAEIREEGEGVWHIRDFGRGLHYRHLTQNENDEKLESKKPIIGKFGVGLKDALATLNRHGIQVFMRSAHGTITVERSAKHGFEDVSTLHGLIEPAPDENIPGTDVELRGIGREHVQEAMQRFLRYSDEEVLETTGYGQVIGCSRQRGARIYINGILVAEEERLLFSYNITSLTKELRSSLNRERRNLGRSAYSDRVKKILLDCKSSRVATTLVKDLGRFTSGDQHEEMRWLDVAVHACKLLNAAEPVMFVTSEEMTRSPDTVGHARKDGLRIVVIPDNVAQKIRGARDRAGAPVRDIATDEAEWNQSFTFQFIEPAALSPEERRVFETSGDIFRAIGGRPPEIRKLAISETMRLEKGFETVGLWESAEQRIVIKRTQLQDRASLAATLLHEVAHALSGAPDCNEDFESELTRLLGLVSCAYLETMVREG